jgi:hypothetical protein
MKQFINTLSFLYDICEFAFSSREARRTLQAYKLWKRILCSPVQLNAHFRDVFADCLGAAVAAAALLLSSQSSQALSSTAPAYHA